MCLAVAALLVLTFAPASPSGWEYSADYDNFYIPNNTLTDLCGNKVNNTGYRTNDWHIEQRFTVASGGVVRVWYVAGYFDVDPLGDYDVDDDASLHAWLWADYESEFFDYDTDRTALWVNFKGIGVGEVAIDTYARKWDWDWGDYDLLGTNRFYVTVY